MEQNFNKRSAEEIDSLNTPYDYFYVMHYEKTAFGNGSLTMKTKDPAYQDKIKLTNGFSNTHKVQINKMYCGM